VQISKPAVSVAEKATAPVSSVQARPQSTKETKQGTPDTIKPFSAISPPPASPLIVSKSVTKPAEEVSRKPITVSTLQATGESSHGKKEPPPLPPRPASPRGSPREGNKKGPFVEAPLRTSPSLPTLDKPLKDETNRASVELKLQTPDKPLDVEPNRGIGAEPMIPIPDKLSKEDSNRGTSAEPKLPIPSAQSTSVEPKIEVAAIRKAKDGSRVEGSFGDSKTSGAAKGPTMLGSVAKIDSSLLDPVQAPSASEELRSNIAPWTVWAEGPDETLANNELRKNIAPWTTEPDPAPEHVARRSSSTEEKEPATDKSIAMDSFFSSGSDDHRGGNEEFENPLLKMQEKADDNNEEVISKPSLAKKPWIGGGVKPAETIAPTSKTQTEKKAESKPKNKIIDYGEIFKAPVVDDEDNSFMNDPEFKDAPDFEW
jgi:hypothetical protein